MDGGARRDLDLVVRYHPARPSQLSWGVSRLRHITRGGGMPRYQLWQGALVLGEVELAEAGAVLPSLEPGCPAPSVRLPRELLLGQLLPTPAYAAVQAVCQRAPLAILAADRATPSDAELRAALDASTQAVAALGLTLTDTDGTPVPVHYLAVMDTGGLPDLADGDTLVLVSCVLSRTPWPPPLAIESHP